MLEDINEGTKSFSGSLNKQVLLEILINGPEE